MCVKLRARTRARVCVCVTGGTLEIQFVPDPQWLKRPVLKLGFILLKSVNQYLYCHLWQIKNSNIHIERGMVFRTFIIVHNHNINGLPAYIL